MKFFGWDYFQWNEAWKEFEGDEMPPSIFAQLCTSAMCFKKEDMPLIDKATSVHDKWMRKHAYEPLRSPIVVEHGYRLRA